MPMSSYNDGNLKHFFRGLIDTSMAVSIKKIFRDLTCEIKYNRYGFRFLVNKYLSSERERMLLFEESHAIRCKYRGLKAEDRIIRDRERFSILTRMCDQISKSHLHDVFINSRTNIALHLYLHLSEEVKRES